MKILTSPNTPANSVIVYKNKGENFLQMAVRLPSKWGHDCIYRSGGNLHDGGSHFEVSGRDEGVTTDFEFCLVPETFEDKNFLDGQKFHSYNKNDCYWVFLPYSDTVPPIEWEVMS